MVLSSVPLIFRVVSRLPVFSPSPALLMLSGGVLDSHAEEQLAAVIFSKRTVEIRRVGTFVSMRA